MRFKAKLSKQGNGYCIYVPVGVRTGLDMDREYEWEIRTEGKVITEKVRTVPKNITSEKIERSPKMEWCKKHDSWKITCGCK